MDNSNKMSDEVRMQSLLQAFLVSRRTLKSSAAETSFHLDEDSLAAFTEGNLGERESLPVVEHLIDCGFCLHKTAELVRLDLKFEGAAEDIRPSTAAEPHKISSVLSGLLAKIFGSQDQAVFAHNENEADDKQPQEDDETEKEK